MIKETELDRETEPKEKVQVRIVVPEVKLYKRNEDDFKDLTKRVNGSMSVKMI